MANLLYNAINRIEKINYKFFYLCDNQSYLHLLECINLKELSLKQGKSS